VRAQQSVASKRCRIVVANDERSERLSGSLHQYALSTRPAAAVTIGFLRLAARRAGIRIDRGHRKGVPTNATHA
jgi:hypothetical protein